MPKRRGRPPKPQGEALSDPLTLRLPAALLERIDALVADYGTRATVIRTALLQGVRALERQQDRDAAAR